jgi:peptide/nickel transport system permease protein
MTTFERPPVGVSPAEPSALGAEAPVPEGGDVASSGAIWRQFYYTFTEHRLAVFGAVTIVIVVLFCFVGPHIYHTDQVYQNLDYINARPGTSHRPLGADNNGYDILGRLMYGGQVSLEVATAVALAVTVIGVVVGAISGYFGGIVDTLIMRICDIGLSFPVVFLFIFMSRIYTPTKGLLIILLTVTVWFIPARLVRGETLSLRTREYVQAVKGMGGRSRRIIARHIIPNTVGTIIVNATFQVADAIIILATLEFLGFSLPPPTPTWGGMLSDGTTFLQDGYWWEVYPALIIIVLTVVSFNFVGDALRDSFDVRLQKR